MKTIEQIREEVRFVTLEAAINEIRRELKQRVGTDAKPGGAYTRWANSQPAALSKHREYEKQTACLMAALAVLETLDDEAWNRRMQATTSQQKLF